VAFLQQLRRHLQGPFTLVWDGNKPHTSQPVREYLARHPQIQVEPLPPYAPDLNPDEGVWTYTKYARLANYAPNNTRSLRRQLTTELKRMSKKPELLKACFRQTKLPLKLRP
jgi:transposase